MLSTERGCGAGRKPDELANTVTRDCKPSNKKRPFLWAQIIQTIGGHA